MERISQADTEERYYQLPQSMYTPQLAPAFLARKPETGNPYASNGHYDSDRYSPAVPQHVSQNLGSGRVPIFNSYKRRNATSVFQTPTAGTSANSAGTHASGMWHSSSGSNYLHGNAASIASDPSYQAAPFYQYGPMNLHGNPGSIMHSPVAVDEARKLSYVPVIGYPKQPMNGYGHSEHNGRVLAGFHSIPTQQSMLAPYGTSLGSSSIHSLSPVSLTGSDSLMSQASARTYEGNGAMPKQPQSCMHCKLEPELKMWPCGCSTCAKCGGAVLQALARQMGMGEDTFHAAFQEPCPKCLQPVANILSVQPQRNSNTVYQMETFNKYQGEMTESNHMSNDTTDMESSSTAITYGNNGYSPTKQKADASLVPFVELGTFSNIKEAETRPPITPLEAGVVKIENIPYNLTENVLFEFLGRNIGLLPEECGGGVHIIMDRTTGKTMDCFLEFVSTDAAQRFINYRMSNSRRCVLGGRHVSMESVDPKVLMKWLFPKVRGASWSRAGTLVQEPSESGTKVEILSREELVMIVSHARTPHRSPFSRKCLQRPYESLISIILKFPWYATEFYTIRQRDYIYRAVFDAIDLLWKHIKRGRTAPNLDQDLLIRLCRVAIGCAGFTDKQKKDLFALSEMSYNGIDGRFDLLTQGPLDGVFMALTLTKGTDEATVELISNLLSGKTTEAAHPYDVTNPSGFGFLAPVGAGLLRFSSSPHSTANSADAEQDLPGSDNNDNNNHNHNTDNEVVDENLTMKQAARVEWAIVNKVLGKYFIGAS